MRRCIIIISLIQIITQPLHSDDYRDFILGSDRTDNQNIFNLILAEDLNDQVSILKILGQRTDSFVEDFIFGCMEYYYGARKERFGYLLRVLLLSVFNPGYEQGELESRILTNKTGIIYLIDHIYEFDQPLLKCQIFWLVPYLHGMVSLGPCMTEGNRLLIVLRSTMGSPGKETDEEIKALLELIQQVGNADFISLCVSIIGLSRSRDVVEMARITIKKIAEQGK